MYNLLYTPYILNEKIFIPISFFKYIPVFNLEIMCVCICHLFIYSFCTSFLFQNRDNPKS